MAKQYCINCGSIVDDSTGYCPVCGEALNKNTNQPVETPAQATINVSFPKDPEIESTQQIPVTIQQETLSHIPAQNVQVNEEINNDEVEVEERHTNPVKNFFSRIVYEPDDDEVVKKPRKRTRDVEEDEEESGVAVLPIVLVVILSILVGSIGYLWIVRPEVLNSGLEKIGLSLPGYQNEEIDEPTSSPEETVTPEATIEPEVTAEPSLGTVTVNLEAINIRSLPSTSGDALGKATKGSSYEILAQESAEGYTWYKIGEDQWIADQDGTWVTVTQ